MLPSTCPSAVEEHKVNQTQLSCHLSLLIRSLNLLLAASIPLPASPGLHWGLATPPSPLNTNRAKTQTLLMSKTNLCGSVWSYQIGGPSIKPCFVLNYTRQFSSECLPQGNKLSVTVPCFTATAFIVFLMRYQSSSN